MGKDGKNMGRNLSFFKMAGANRPSTKKEEGVLQCQRIGGGVKRKKISSTAPFLGGGVNKPSKGRGKMLTLWANR